MKLALIGVGQAGGKIVDEFLEYEMDSNSEFITAAAAVNTAHADLTGLKHVPEDNRILIGQDRVRGHGVGADNELGAEIAEADRNEIMSATDQVPMGRTDAFLVVGALGGGTGSGASPVIAKHLQHVYTIPVYGLGVLPGADEGGIYTLNAARSFRTFVNEVDNLMLFDNDAWRQSGESVGDSYAAINEEIAKRFGVLFSAGEVHQGRDVAESVVDSSEIINTLAAGGVSTVGYAHEPVENQQSGLLSRFTGDDDADENVANTTNRISSTVRKATLGRLTLPCDVDSADRALTVVAGPPDFLSRKGIESGREWLEQEANTMEARGGDYPRPGADHVAATVLLSGVTSVPRLDVLREVAVEAQDSIQEQRDESQQEFEAFVQNDELDPLY